jgi:hypothetical protein
VKSLYETQLENPTVRRKSKSEAIKALRRDPHNPLLWLQFCREKQPINEWKLCDLASWHRIPFSGGALQQAYEIYKGGMN